MSDFKFKKDHSFESRVAEADRVKMKYPDRIPVICEMHSSVTDVKLDKNKYLVPKDLTAGAFLYTVRKRIKLPAEKALFMFVNNTLMPTHTLISQIYKENKEDDGFLYVSCSMESTFGQ
jgi:GABA(A) receptor-associated protein